MSANVPDVPVEILPFLKQRPGLTIFGTKTTKPPSQSQSISYRCEVCPFETKNQQHHQNHMMEHKSKDCPCPICGKIYKNESRLHVHMQTHQAGLPHVCIYCEKRFKTQTLLNNHMKTHFPSPIFCTVCNKSCSSKAVLKRHLQTAHSIDAYQK